jgi:hypothetical protein
LEYELPLAAAKLVFDGRWIKTSTAQQQQRVEPKVGDFTHDTVVFFAESGDHDLDGLLAHFACTARGAFS